MQDLKSVGPQLKLYTGVGVTPQLCCVNKWWNRELTLKCKLKC